MQANKKHQIRVGSMLKNDVGQIVRVKHYIFSDLITYQFGNPIEDNVVHIDIYNAEDLETPVESKDFVNLNFVHPIPITEALLYKIGFRLTEMEGRTVLQCNNCVIPNLQSIAGVFTVINAKTNIPYGIEYVHEAQFLAAEL